MKLKMLFMSLWVLAITGGYAQIQKPPFLGSVTFFAEEGEKFTLYLNGEAQNAKPQPNVKVDEVTDVMISVRIVFEDATIPPIKKSFMRGGIDCNYMIKKNKKESM